MPGKSLQEQRPEQEGAGQWDPVGAMQGTEGDSAKLERAQRIIEPSVGQWEHSFETEEVRHSLLEHFNGLNYFLNVGRTGTWHTL